VIEMTDTNEWLIKRLGQLENEEQSFIKKSLYLAAQDLVREQGKRIEQAQQEIDGRIWSPDKW
jgi:hypothetical protein